MKQYLIKIADLGYFKKIDDDCLCSTIYKSDALSSEIKGAILDRITALKYKFPDYKFTMSTYEE